MLEEDIKKLPAEERLAKLKELEEKRKKELDETAKLIKESVEEIQDNQEKKRKIPIDQVKALNLESLQTQEEKQIFRTQRFVSEIDKDDNKESDQKTDIQENKTKIKYPENPDNISLEQTVQNEPIPENISKSQQTQYTIPEQQQPSTLYQLVQEAVQPDAIERIRELEGRPYREWNLDEREFARRMNYVADTDKDRLKNQYHGKIAEEMISQIDNVKQEMERLRGDYIQ